MTGDLYKITNANIYDQDGRSFYGQAEEVTFPDLKAKQIEHKGLGMLGVVDIPVGIDKMSVKVKWGSINSDVIKQSADFYTSRLWMIRANMAVMRNGSKVADQPVIGFLNLLPKNAPAIGIKNQDDTDMETEFSVNAYRLEMNGEAIFDINLYAHKYIVNGVDLTAQQRANLGI